MNQSTKYIQKLKQRSYEQQLLLPQAIQKRIYKADAKNEVKIVSERQLLLSHYLEK